MPDDVPHLPNTVSWAEARASIELRRETRIAMKQDPDEGPIFDRIWRELEDERLARAKAGRKI